MKDPRVEEPKPRSSESSSTSTAPSRSNNSEFSAKARRNKKKDRRQNDQWQRQQKGSTPATGANAAKPGEANKKKNDDSNRYLRVGHHVTLGRVRVITAIKRAILQNLARNLQKTSFGLGDLRAGNWG